MHYKTCELCGLRSGRVLDQKRLFMARFPLDEDRCKKWVKVAGKEDLAYIPLEKLHKLKYICGKHFRAQDFKKKKTQLKRNAVPSLLITAEPLSDEILIEFPLHIAPNNRIVKQHSPLNETARSHVESLTSTVKTTDTGTANAKTVIPCSPRPCSPNVGVAPVIYYSDHNYCRPNFGTPKPSIIIEEKNNRRARPSSPIPSTSTTESTVGTDKLKIIEISCSPKSSKETMSANTMTQIKLLNKLKKSKDEIRKLRKRLNQIEKISSPILKSLIDSTLINQNRKPKGKRWTELNKSIALDIYKKFPESYKYLSQLLPLPSIRTLQTLLQNMQMEPGQLV